MQSHPTPFFELAFLPKNENAQTSFFKVGHIIQNTYVSPLNQEQFTKNYSLIKSKYQSYPNPSLTIEQLIQNHFISDRKYILFILLFTYLLNKLKEEEIKIPSEARKSMFFWLFSQYMSAMLANLT